LRQRDREKYLSLITGLSVSELKRIKDLEQENARLKRMYADLSLVHEALKDAIEKKH
jgi:putative transposase